MIAYILLKFAMLKVVYLHQADCSDLAKVQDQDQLDRLRCQVGLHLM